LIGEKALNKSVVRTLINKNRETKMKTIEKKHSMRLSISLLALTTILAAAAPLAASAHEFTATDAEEEGYWYSRYNLGNLSMRSGLGKVVMPDMQVIMMAMAGADADFDPAQFKAGNMAYGDGDHITPPQNVAPIAAVYKSGDPHFISKFNPTDFGTQRWDPAKMDTSLTGAANGWAIMKETEWARQFHVDDHFGTPDSDFGAYWRFVGAVMTMNAKLQAGSFMQNMAGYDLSGGGDAVMLMALADLADLLSTDGLAHSEVANRYKAPDMAGKVAAAADKLLAQVVAGNQTSIHDRALTIQALVWYAAKTSDAGHKAEALAKLADLAHGLQGMQAKDATERAWALRGLIEAHRVLGINDGTIRSMGAAFLDDFNLETGGFDSQSAYSIDDFGVIIGALNAMRIFETADIDADQAEEVFRVFWEEVMNKGGLQMSAPPIKIAKSPFEYEGEPETYFRYDASQPVPPMAGGEFGVAPVFATEVSYSGGTWAVSDAMFDAAGAMHASNEMIWLHYDEINGFPVVDLSDVLK